MAWYGHCNKSAVWGTPPVACRVLESTGATVTKADHNLPLHQPTS